MDNKLEGVHSSFYSNQGFNQDIMDNITKKDSIENS